MYMCLLYFLEGLFFYFKAFMCIIIIKDIYTYGQFNR